MLTLYELLFQVI